MKWTTSKLNKYMFRYFKYCIQTILNWKTSQNTDLYKLIESIIYSFKIWYFYTSLPLSVNELQKCCHILRKNWDQNFWMRNSTMTEQNIHNKNYTWLWAIENVISKKQPNHVGSLFYNYAIVYISGLCSVEIFNGFN